MSSDKTKEHIAIAVLALMTAYVGYRLYQIEANNSSPASTKKNDVVKLSVPPKMSTPAPAIVSIPSTPTLEGTVMENSGISSIVVHEIKSLQSNFPSMNVSINRPAVGFRSQTYNKLIGKEDVILNEIVRKGTGMTSTDAFIRAGPRASLHFEPTTVRAAIVTCGGLCPGLNVVIRELVHALYYLYNVDTVIGIRGGFSGFSGAPGYEPLHLTTEVVENIHHAGGSILGSSRGGFDQDVIINFLKKNNINQLYVIGGDGTHRAANILAEACFNRLLNISIAGIPKTIDNDVDLIDRSFGFTTSVEAAQAAIISAKTEARCNLPNGVGIVKLMGRSAGFIAVHATMASGDVDLCLVPEIQMKLHGEEGCLPFLLKRVKEQGHAVVVVAEGAGEDLLGQSAEVDKGGNRKLPKIGEFLQQEVVKYFASQGSEATVKYIDPSYMIRSVPANASDALYCMLLAQNAVHGAMAGFTAFSTGLVNNRMVYIPIPRMVATSPRVMDPLGRTWERVLSMTRQPAQEPAFDHTQCSVNDRTIC